MSLVSRPSHFPGLGDAAYLDTAAEGLPPLAAREALAAYWAEKSSGTPGRARHYAIEHAARAGAAALLAADPDDVVLLANASEALNLLAHAIDWRPGDEVLVTDLEFPSNVIVWLRLRERGVRLVVIPSRDGVVTLDDWLRHLTPRTRLVSVSQVSYKTGTQFPYLAALGAAAREAGALFCVDATQALGRVPVSVEGVDFLVASSYKWLLGPHGLAVVYLSPAFRERYAPATAGWYSVASVFHPARFESYTAKPDAGQLQAGMPNFPALYMLEASLRFLGEIGVERLDQALAPLVARLASGLTALGLPLLTPADPAYASGIVSVAHAAPEALARRLAGQGVIVWGGDGRLRLSVHLYNEAADIDRALAAFANCS